MVKMAWLQGDSVIMNSLRKVKEDSLVFNFEIFGNIIHRTKKMEARLRGIQRRLEEIDFASLIRLEQELQMEYNMVLYEDEIFWYQKYRENYVHLGDWNTRFFHTQMIVKRKRNRIHGL